MSLFLQTKPISAILFTSHLRQPQQLPQSHLTILQHLMTSLQQLPRAIWWYYSIWWHHCNSSPELSDDITASADTIAVAPQSYLMTSLHLMTSRQQLSKAIDDITVQPPSKLIVWDEYPWASSYVLLTCSCDSGYVISAFWHMEQK